MRVRMSNEGARKKKGRQKRINNQETKSSSTSVFYSSHSRISNLDKLRKSKTLSYQKLALQTVKKPIKCTIKSRLAQSYQVTM